MTESSYNNSLADHHIWSTIKTLPATLPEPRAVVRGPSFEAQGPSFTDHRPAVTDHGPRTGVTEGVSKSDLDLVIGGGAAGRRGLRLGSAVYLIDRPPVCFLTLVISVAKIIQTVLEVLQFVICNR